MQVCVLSAEGLTLIIIAGVRMRGIQIRQIARPHAGIAWLGAHTLRSRSKVAVADAPKGGAGLPVNVTESPTDPAEDVGGTLTVM
jgi:hypothetical protein